MTRIDVYQSWSSWIEIFSFYNVHGTKRLSCLLVPIYKHRITFQKIAVYFHRALCCFFVSCSVTCVALHNFPDVYIKTNFHYDVVPLMLKNFFFFFNVMQQQKRIMFFLCAQFGLCFHLQFSIATDKLWEERVKRERNIVKSEWWNKKAGYEKS